MTRRKPIFYADDETYAVELGDEVELQSMMTGPLTHVGEVTAIFPRRMQVRVRYRDEGDWTKQTADPKSKVATVPTSCLTLIARAM